MSKLQINARWKIHNGKLETFKQLAGECIGIVKDKDVNTDQFELFSVPTIRNTFFSKNILIQTPCSLTSQTWVVYSDSYWQ